MVSVTMFEKHKNPDGTYNGATLLAEVTGLSAEEVTWTFNRLRQLKNEGKTVEEAKAIVREEEKNKSWTKTII